MQCSVVTFHIPLYTLRAGDARVDLAVSLLGGWHLGAVLWQDPAAAANGSGELGVGSLCVLRGLVWTDNFIKVFKRKMDAAAHCSCRVY